MSVTLVVDDGPFDWHLGRVSDSGLKGLRVVDLAEGIEDVPFKARVVSAAPELGGVFVDIARNNSVFVRLPARLRRSPPTVGSILEVQGLRDAAGSKSGRAATGWRLRPTGTGEPGLWLAGLERAVAVRATERRAPAMLLDDDERLQTALLATGHDAAIVLCRTSNRLRIERLLAPLAIDAQVVAAASPWCAAGVAGALEAALQPEVQLPSAAAIVIEPTQALVAVDVDRRAAAANAAAINAEAVAALADAIAVRELGGQIVVDFLDPGGNGPRVELQRRLRQAVAPLDGTVVALLGSGLAVVERPRRRISLAERVDPSRAAAAALLRRAARHAHHRAKMAADVDDLLHRPAYAAAAARWLTAAGSTLQTERDVTLPPGAVVDGETIG